jgi:hypothetical protein
MHSVLFEQRAARATGHNIIITRISAIAVVAVMFNRKLVRIVVLSLLFAMPSAAVASAEDWSPSEDIDSIKRIDWRLDPKSSYSDYTLEIDAIFDESSGDSLIDRKLYHVHKNILSVGRKKSELFAKLFQQRDITPSPIKLPKLAADAIPYMLDYIYGETTDSLEITTETATALFYLGEYFQVRQMQWDVLQFWQTNIIANEHNYLTYYEHATVLNVQPIILAVARICAYQLLKLQTPEKIVQLASPQFWLQVLQVTLTESDGIFMARDVSVHVSTLTARVCNRNSDMDAKLFQQLIEPNFLPYLDAQAAMTFLDLEDRFVCDRSEDKLSSLQDRCIDALSDSWQGGTWATDSFLKRQTALLVRELLVRSLSKARVSLLEQEKQTTEAVRASRRQQITVEKELRIAKDLQSELERDLTESRRIQRKLKAELGLPQNESHSLSSSS